MPRDLEEKVVFGVSADAGDGVPLVVVGIPAGAWDYMRDGRTNHFDLTRIGLPIKLVLFGAADHATAKAAIEAGQAAAGEASLDLRREDFSIKPARSGGK